MSNDLLTVNENEQLTELVQQMQGKAVRRVPVVDVNGALVGIVTADDLILDSAVDRLEDVLTF